MYMFKFKKKRISLKCITINKMYLYIIRRMWCVINTKIIFESTNIVYYILQFQSFVQKSIRAYSAL